MWKQLCSRGLWEIHKNRVSGLHVCVCVCAVWYNTHSHMHTHTVSGVCELINVVDVKRWPFLVEPPAAAGKISVFQCVCVCVCVCVCFSVCVCVCVFQCVCVPSLSLQGVRAPEEAQQLVLDGGVEAHVQPVNPHRLQLAVQHHHVHLIGRVGEVAVNAHDSAPRPVGLTAAGAAFCCDGHPVHLKEEEEEAGWWTNQQPQSHLNFNPFIVAGFVYVCVNIWFRKWNIQIIGFANV